MDSLDYKSEVNNKVKLDEKNIENKYPEGGWCLEEYYLWDNWIADSRKYDKKMHRYSLCAPKIGKNGEYYGPNDRHDNAYVRHSYSIDNGKTWCDTGASFSSQVIEKVGKMLWSGCCVIKEETNLNQTYSFIMCITASGRDEKSGNYIQKIGISLSNDGEKWTPIEICCEYQNIHGYDMTNEDGEGYCWRDPYLYYDYNNDKKWHLFWGAKKRTNNNKLIAVIGHAICKNNELFNEWEICPGIELPLNYGQAELPAMYYYHNYYYMFVCCQSASTNTCSYHIFVSKNIDNNYELIYSSCRNNHDQKNHFVNKNIYALTIFETYDHQIKAVGFFDQLMGKELMLTNTPIIDIEWNNHVYPPKPHIKYNQIVAQNYRPNNNNNNINVNDEEKELENYFSDDDGDIDYSE